MRPLHNASTQTMSVVEPDAAVRSTVGASVRGLVRGLVGG
jgi:hypothetical protein